MPDPAQPNPSDVKRRRGSDSAPERSRPEAARPNQRATDRRGSVAAPERRRAEDRTAPSGPGSGQQSRARELFQRFRQPMIGLGLIGGALPLVHAQSQQEKPARSGAAAPEQFADPLAIAQHTQEAEENVVEQIAVSREEQKRTEYVDSAVDTYDIPRAMAEDIYDIAVEQGIEPRLAYGLVRTESTFDERARSPVGALGLTQVMPRTAKWMQPGTKTEDLYDRQTNLRLGFRYLDQMIAKYKGNVRLALLAYNRGPGTVDKVLKRGGNPDNGYADKVLGS